MAELRRVPPGRAGRLWLRRRRDTAQRAVDLLDRKLRILMAEQARFRLLAARTETDWHEQYAQARVWLARAAAIGQQREIRFAAAEPTADVDIEWAAVMGVRYPAEATCRLPEASPGARPPGTAALAPAEQAHREALRAAVAHAVALRACHVVDAEVVEARRRLRALTDRWVPRLEAAAHTLSERLEEDERADTVRMRWAAGRAERDGAPR
jgi:V/A-type H+/Na+-transporting ATPase subunit D